MKTAYGYVQDKTITKDRKPSFIDEQQQRIEDYSRKNNIKILKFITDVGYSKSNLNTSSHQKIMKLLKRKPTECLIVSDVKEIFPNPFEYFQMKRDLKSYGCELISVSGFYWDSTEYDRLTINQYKYMENHVNKLLKLRSRLIAVNK